MQVRYYDNILLLSERIIVDLTRQLESATRLLYDNRTEILIVSYRHRIDQPPEYHICIIYNDIYIHFFYIQYEYVSYIFQ